MTEVKIEESSYGDEYLFGGANGGTIEISGRWVCGGKWYKKDVEKLGRMRHEALVIKEALEILEAGKTPRQLAEENTKLREQISLLERQLEDAYDEQRVMYERHGL